MILAAVVALAFHIISIFNIEQYSNAHTTAGTVTKTLVCIVKTRVSDRLNRFSPLSCRIILDCFQANDRIVRALGVWLFKPNVSRCAWLQASQRAHFCWHGGDCLDCRILLCCRP